MSQRFGITFALVKVWLLALLAGGYSALTLWYDQPPFHYVPQPPDIVDAALSFAMAVLIAFRVNRAYERWWEARTLWGSLVNVSRNLAVKIKQLQRPQPADCQYTRDLIVSYCLGLRDHLRDSVDLANLPAYEAVAAPPIHLPSNITSRLYHLVEDWRLAGTLPPEQLWVLDAELRKLLDICGGCERIKNTLMPISWRSITWQFIVLYLIVLPWGLIDNFGAWTIPVTILVAYMALAAEVVAQFVEEPFGRNEDHLDLDRMCNAIDQSVSEVLLADDASD